jgi:ABC-type sulfate transport system substrate-binding protein
MGRLIHTGPQDLSAKRPSAPVYYRLTIYLIAALLLALILYHGRTALFGGYRSPVKLIVYCFSTQEELLSQHIFPAFEESWEARTGRDLSIEGVFGPSGTLANQILMGAPADVAIFSNEQHVSWLRIGRQVNPETRAEVIGWTPMVIVTRPGNAFDIRGFADLAQPGLALLHPEPGRSGAGDWALLAEYGSFYLVDSDRHFAEEQLAAIWGNVKVLGSSAKATLSLFEMGAGDALVTYEQDALLALDRRVPLEIVVPPRTIVAQHVAVVIDDNVTPPQRAAAQDFVDYLVSGHGQELLGQYHMRPATDDSAAFAGISQPFSIKDLGGWSKAYHDVIEGIWPGQLAPGLTTDPLPTFQHGQD